MIAKITGIVDTVSLADVIVDVNGIGYEIVIPLSTYDLLPKESEKVTLNIFHYVREDAIILYGFVTLEEKELFKLLTTVTGIGPKLALKILSSSNVRSLCEAIVNVDIKTISKINGLGKKSAERLVIELKDKIHTISPEAAYGEQTVSKSLTKQAEAAMLALVQLGFKQETARKIIKKISSELSETELNSENIIRLALQHLNS
ncbi:MAG TPA: Holliday junction branch migration protein RuvA [Victivallales bacterium]|nr:Holliday junction branch migration protein RuvA [Victivallales bacterium]